MSHLRLLAPELTLAATGLLLLLLTAAGRRPRSAWTGLLAAGGCFGAWWFLFPLRKEYLSAVGGGLLVDSLAFYFQALLLAVTLLTLVVAAGWVRRNPQSGSRFQVLVLWESAALLLLVAAGELTALYVVFTVAVALGLATAALAVPAAPPATQSRTRPPLGSHLRFRLWPCALAAGFAAALLLYGLGLVYGLAGTTNYEEIGVRLTVSGGPPLQRLAMLLFLAGPGLALALVPFHFWLPALVDAAPAPVGAYLAVAPKLAGLAVLLRFFPTSLPAQVESWAPLFAAAAAGSIVFGSLAALVQTRPKSLLAYLSLAQSGYLLLSLAALSLEGLTAALFQAALYALASLGAFSALAAREDSIRRPSAWPAAALTVSLLSLAGVPPLAGFFGEFVLFLAAVHQGQSALAFLGAGLSVVCAYPCLRLAAALGRRADGPEPEPGSRATPPRTAPTTLLATGLLLGCTLGLSVFPGWLLQAAEWVARRFWG